MGLGTRRLALAARNRRIPTDLSYLTAPALLLWGTGRSVPHLPGPTSMTDPTRQPEPRPPIAAIEALLREDAGFEPPAAALERALGLRTRIAARRADSPSLLAKVGDMMDLAGARVVEWLGLSPDTALAGVRDDRGAEIVDAAIPGSDLVLVAERSVGEDAVARIVGEFRHASGAAVRGRIAVLDGENRVLADGELDAFGMFSLTLARNARRVVFMQRGPEAHGAVVVDLGARTRGDA